MIPAEVLDSDAWRRATGAEKDVYLTLARYADGYVNDDLRACFPGIKSITRWSGRNQRTVERAIDRLCERGLIARDTGVGRTHTNNYTLIKSGLQTGVYGGANGKVTPVAPSKTPAASSLNPGRAVQETPVPRPDEQTIEETKKKPTQHTQAAAPPVGVENPSERSERQKAIDALTRFGVQRSGIDHLPADLTADTIVRHWLAIDRRAAKNPPGILVAALKNNSKPPATQPIPKQVSVAWNSGHIEAVTLHESRIENTGDRARYNGESVTIPSATKAIKIPKDQIPNMIFE